MRTYLQYCLNLKLILAHSSLLLLVLGPEWNPFNPLIKSVTIEREHYLLHQLLMQQNKMLWLQLSMRNKKSQDTELDQWRSIVHLVHNLYHFHPLREVVHWRLLAALSLWHQVAPLTMLLDLCHSHLLGHFGIFCTRKLLLLATISLLIDACQNVFHPPYIRLPSVTMFQVRRSLKLLSHGFTHLLRYFSPYYITLVSFLDIPMYGNCWLVILIVEIYQI